MNQETVNHSANDNLTNMLNTAMHDPVYQMAAAGTALVIVLASCRLCSKMGYHALLGLLLFVPVVNVFVFLFLAFARWPISREISSLRGVQNTARRADQERLRRAA